MCSANPGDFAVLVLYDADNFYEHPVLKHVPDFDFSGISLQFDVHYTGLQPLDSAKFPTIGWPYLQVIRPEHSTVNRRLVAIDGGTKVGGTHSQAQATFTVSAAPAQRHDRVTIWYQNWAFDYWVGETGGNTAEQAATALAQNINNTAWNDAQAIEAEVNGPEITIRAKKPGRDGNMITIYCQSATETLKITPEAAKLSGGNSDATWRVNLDFDALDISQIRQCWLTFAPELSETGQFTSKEWEATFTNWTVTGDKKWLKIPGPLSLRLEESDPACRYSGSSWALASGFYSQGFARRATSAGDSVTIDYECASQHDLWIGTTVFKSRPGLGAAGVWGVTLDGSTIPNLNTSVDPDGRDPACSEDFNTRRLLRRDVSPGRHSVKLTLLSGAAFFDFLEAVVVSEYVPLPRPNEADLSPALDYSTDHTYKLPPARILWAMEQLGYGGPMNLYMGVFWYNQRKRVDGAPLGLRSLVIPSVTVTFEGEFLPHDQVIINIGGQPSGKTILPTHTTTPELIAKHFEYLINSTYVGVWAAAQDNTLVITLRSPKDAYSYTFDAWVESKNGDGGYSRLRDLAVTGSLQGGSPGIWQVDPEQEYGINRGGRAWLSDMFTCLAQQNREIVVATSMELVYPPHGFAAAFPDGLEVTTDVGFGSLHSTHCTFNTLMRAHHIKVYKTIAGLMQSAGLTPNLQFGEFLWWFFSRPERTFKPGAVANSTPIEIWFDGVPHGLQNGDTIVNSGYEGCTAANGTWTVTIVNQNQVALNGSSGNGQWVNGSGVSKKAGGGGMAFYDEETKSAAQAALGRPLHVFGRPTDDPAINGGADAFFLRDRLRDYVAALVASIRADYRKRPMNPSSLMGRDTLHSCFMTETMIEAAAAKDDQWRERIAEHKSTADCL